MTDEEPKEEKSREFLMRNAPQNLPEFCILTSHNFPDIYEELDDRGIRGWSGYRNVPLKKGDNKGQDKTRMTFMKHTSGLRLLSSELKTGKYKLRCPVCNKVTNEYCQKCKRKPVRKPGHWEMWKFQLTHPGNDDDIQAEDTTITLFFNVDKGRCNDCSDIKPGKHYGWFPLPKCPYCKKNLSYVPKYDPFTNALLDALQKTNHHVSDSNWRDWEIRLQPLRGKGPKWKIQFLPWNKTLDVPDDFISSALVESPPVTPGLNETQQAFVDKAQTDIEELPTLTLMSRSKWTTWVRKYDAMLTSDEIQGLWENRWDYMPYWPIPRE